MEKVKQNATVVGATAAAAAKAAITSPPTSTTLLVSTSPLPPSLRISPRPHLTGRLAGAVGHEGQTQERHHAEALGYWLVEECLDVCMLPEGITAWVAPHPPLSLVDPGDLTGCAHVRFCRCQWINQHMTEASKFLAPFHMARQVWPSATSLTISLSAAETAATFASCAKTASLPAGEVFKLFKQLRHLLSARRQPTWRPRAAVMAGQVSPLSRSLTIAASSGCHPPYTPSGRDAKPVAAAAGAAAVAVAGGTSSLSCFFLFLTFCFFSLTVGESSESASVAPSRNLAGPTSRAGADGEGSGG